MLAKQLVDEALKLDNNQEHLPAVSKYLEALVYLNKSLLDLCRQRDVRVGKKDFGNNVRLASNCMTRVCEIHELFRQSLLAQETGAPSNGDTGNGTAGGSSSSSSVSGSNVENGTFSTVGPNDPIALAINYNRRLLSQFDETVHRRKRDMGQRTTSGDIEQRLRLERKQFENLSLAKEDNRRTNVPDIPTQTWSPRSKAQLASRIKDRSQSEHRISAAKSFGALDLIPSNAPWLSKYLKLLAKDEDVDIHSSQYSRLPKLEEVFGPELAASLSSEERKRQAAMLEFMYTEHTHVRNLKILNVLFKAPLMEHQLLPANFVFPYLRMTMLDLLFSNLDEVIEIHGQINKALKTLARQRRPVTNFGDIMSKFFDGPFADRFMAAVSKFCRHQQYAIDQLEIRRLKDDRFAAFLKEVESLPVCRGLKLGAMLPMEIQRITKYHLMFERILDYEPRDTNQFQHLQRCYTKAKEIAEYVNAEKRNFESVHKLAELQHRMEIPNGSSASNGDLGQGFNLQGRVYIYDGQLTLKIGNSAMEIQCVLLEGCLLFLTKSTSDGYRLRLAAMHEGRQSGGYRSDRLSPLVALSAAALRDDKEKSFYVISGLGGEVQVYHLEASKEIDKSKWYSMISEEISKAAGIRRRIPSQSSSIANIQRSVVEYTSDADFDDFSDDDDDGFEVQNGVVPNGHANGE